MDEKQLVVSLIIAFSLIIVLVIVVVFFSLGKETEEKKQANQTTVQNEKKKKIAIEEMVEIAANRNSSKNDLTNAIIKVSKECLFPEKIKGIAPKDAKIYLNFVLLVASHKNANAKLIAFMDFELKKANKNYGTEIDIYETEGLKQRGKRI
ncbi:MAG: hypothetical protein IBX44_09155 [Sulfurospirillum sp.]|nr:hypothetical protein [Sulfurospirillum sp.]